MNRILQGYLQRIDQAVRRIEEAAEASQKEVARLKDDKQRITQQYWARGRKASVLAESQESFEALQAENIALRDKFRQAREHAARIRSLSRALNEGPGAHGGG